MLFFPSVAHAMAPPQGGEGGAQGGSALMSFMPLILMFVIFYFLLIRPQQKKAKDHRELLSALRRGDYVLTTGGMMGEIIDVDGDVLEVELAENLVVRVARAYVAGKVERPRGAKKKGKAKKAVEKVEETDETEES